LIAGFLYDVAPDEAQQLGGVIDRYVEYLDECLGEILGMLEPETTVMLVSDHGHSYRSDSQVNLRPNALLVPLGWTRTVDGSADLAASRVYGRQDPTQTDVLRVYANVQGRGAGAGVVSRGDLDALLEEAGTMLAGLRTAGGEPLFESVERGRGAGTNASDGDLRCRLNRRALGGTLVVGDTVIVVSEFAHQMPKSGNHRITGVFLLSGRDAAKGRRIRGADVFDVIPTLFRLLDLPLSREWEGNAVDDALAPGFRDLMGVRWVRSYESGEEPRDWEETVTEGANDAVLEELRALGYIQ
jgi:predicted AlkP superfamily phosphohydrolase/phosphomutase